ncbi:MAG: nicotinate (nicotinamide) nucleotide adenylyltransferase [Balneolales bacterium]|nr:nicotinate (nicotinamide) nucleotide adenylyltransferase [Balneolales bacterium]
MKPKAIGLYGGTFDPVHSGHLAVIKSFLNSSDFAELWVLPSPLSPFKQGEAGTPYWHRAEMTRIAIRGIPKVKVCTIEETLPKPSYTIHTLEALCKQHPGYAFTVCIGADNLSAFSRWHRYRDILDMADLLVAARPEFSTEAVAPVVMRKVRFAEHEPLSCSSTKLRERLTQGEIPAEIPADVYSYIREHNLYSLNNTSKS